MAKKKKKIIKKIFKKKRCSLCKNNVNIVDYKDVKFLQKFISEKGKILPSRTTGNCTKHQRIVAKVIKRAREACLMPFSK